MNDMDTPFACEYSYSRRSEGKRLWIRVAAILGYALFVGAYFVAAYVSRFIPLFALCPVALWMLIYFTWPIVSYDYYFTFAKGTLTIGKQRRKSKRPVQVPMLEIRVREADKICRIPAGRVKLSGVLKYYDFSGTANSTERIAILITKDGKKCAALVECIPALEKLLSSYPCWAGCVEIDKA